MRSAKKREARIDSDDNELESRDVDSEDSDSSEQSSNDDASSYKRLV